MLKLKNSLTVRGDSLYCPLPLSLDSYGNCLTDCWHCYFRNLNRVWGEDLKPIDLDELAKQLRNGPLNRNPITPVAYLMSQKKTIRFGNKSDPFQEAEKEYGVSAKVISLLIENNWTYVIQTRFTHNLVKCTDLIMKDPKLVTIMPVISPGLDKDWEVLERGRTTPPEQRLRHLSYFLRKGINVGVNGEPFIPGFHTENDFEEALKLLVKYKIPSYNTYNLHFNPFVAKRLYAIGLDIERIWYYNQDKQWKPILGKLLNLSKKYNIRLGCPDFVNSGKDWIEVANTCCGINVLRPATFNTHYFKKLKQQGFSNEEIIKKTYDGAAELEEGVALVKGTNKGMYNLKDAGL